MPHQCMSPVCHARNVPGSCRTGPPRGGVVDPSNLSFRCVETPHLCMSPVCHARNVPGSCRTGPPRGGVVDPHQCMRSPARNAASCRTRPPPGGVVDPSRPSAPQLKPVSPQTRPPQDDEVPLVL
ncbi:hypothetical protein V6N13_048927 [Hibiscus sabdariffa]|uniref:Uncharacterized protein n=1 Tax=Hibiscus sabdariffa TaxID=183260 RepID=A0ABR2QYP9_9ROSI